MPAGSEMNVRITGSRREKKVAASLVGHELQPSIETRRRTRRDVHGLGRLRGIELENQPVDVVLWLHSGSVIRSTPNYQLPIPKAHCSMKVRWELEVGS